VNVTLSSCHATFTNDLAVNQPRGGGCANDFCVTGDWGKRTRTLWVRPRYVDRAMEKMPERIQSCLAYNTFPKFESTVKYQRPVIRN
jgi:hypothetical protein